VTSGRYIDDGVLVMGDMRCSFLQRMTHEYMTVTLASFDAELRVVLQQSLVWCWDGIALRRLLIFNCKSTFGCIAQFPVSFQCVEAVALLLFQGRSDSIKLMPSDVLR
jgi:hypothetical protein